MTPNVCIKLGVFSLLRLVYTLGIFFLTFSIPILRKYSENKILRTICPSLIPVQKGCAVVPKFKSNLVFRLAIVKT